MVRYRRNFIAGGTYREVGQRTDQAARGADVKIFGWRLPFRYNRYLFALDLFGVLSASAVAAYLFCPQLQLSDSRQDSMVANVLSELVGIYVAVRLIELFSRRNETQDRVRVRSVRLMRFLENVINPIAIRGYGVDANRLLRELEWAKNIMRHRRRYFSADELRDIDEFYRLADAFAGDMRTGRNADGSSNDRIWFSDEEKMADLVQSIELARMKAEENILEETSEDSGM
jgi:hypothetical protein